MAKIYLGRSLFEDTFFRRDIFIDDNSHLLTIGCPGAGKSTTDIWPNLALYKGPMLVLDPKAEHARKTFYRRQARLPGARTTRYHFSEGRAYLFDPFRQAPELPSVNCNPLAAVDIESDRVRSMLSGISDGCVFQEDPRNQHFVDMAALLVEGGAAHVLSKNPKECHTLPYLCDQFLGIDPELGVADPKRFQDFLIDMLTNNVAGGIAQLAAAKVMAMGENEKGSVLSTLARSLKWASDPAMRRHLTGESCQLSELVDGDPDKPVTIYVVLPLTMIREQARWMRTVINVALGLVQNAPEPPRQPLVCILDEFAQLGPSLRKVQEGIVTLRSANVRIWPIVQSISQLKGGFGSEWETFITSSIVKLYGVRDLGTAQWASQMCGKDVYRRVEGKLGRGRVAQEQPREMYTPEEIMEAFGKDRPMQLVFPTNGLPMRLRRMAYRPLTINGNHFEGLPLDGHFEEETFAA